MPCSRHRIGFACLFLFLSLIVPLQAQQSAVGSIIGELHLNRGDFAGRVLIELQLHGAPIASQYSDEEGRFGFHGLLSNPYHLVIRDERYDPVDQQIVLDTSISALAIAQVMLTPVETRKAETLVNRESGSNPYLVNPAEYRRRFPKDAIKEFDRGVKADRDQKPDEAIQHYEKSINLAPDFYPAHNNLGSDYLNKTNFADAEKQFREVLRVDQNDSQGYFNLGNVLTLTKRFDEAEKVLQQGLQKQPDSALGNFLLGSLQEQTKQGVDAEKSLRRALELDPALAKAHLVLVNLYLKEARPAEAMDELKLFLKNFPNDTFAPKARDVLKRLQSQSAANKPTPE